MLLKTDKLPEDKPGTITPLMAKILMQFAKQAPRNYALLGRDFPGIPKQPRGDFMWAYTGNVMPMKIRTGTTKNPKIELYPSKVYTLIPTGRKFNKELSWQNRMKAAKSS